MIVKFYSCLFIVMDWSLYFLMGICTSWQFLRSFAYIKYLWHNLGIILWQNLGLIDFTKVTRPLPWRPPTNMKRTKEDVRPIFWYIFFSPWSSHFCVLRLLSVSHVLIVFNKISFQTWAVFCSILPGVRKLMMVVEWTGQTDLGVTSPEL